MVKKITYKLLFINIILLSLVSSIFAVNVDVDLSYGSNMKENVFWPVGAGRTVTIKLMEQGSAVDLCTQPISSAPANYGFSCPGFGGPTDTKTYELVKKDAGTGSRADLYNGVIYRGGLNGDVRIRGDIDGQEKSTADGSNGNGGSAIYTAHFKFDLSGSQKSGRKIIGMGVNYWNQGDAGTKAEPNRVDLIGYTDNNGLLEAWLGHYRYYKFYMDSVAPENLILSTEVFDNNGMQNNRFYFTLDTDKPSAIMNVSATTCTNGYCYRNLDTSYVNVWQPFKFEDTTGKTLCVGYTRVTDQPISDSGSPNRFSSCRINTDTDVKLYVDDSQNVPVWDMIMYQGRVQDDAKLITLYHNTHGQDIEVDLDGADSVNRKLIVKGIGQWNSALDELDRIDAIGYTNSQGKAKFTLTELLFYKIYIDSDDTEDNLIYEGHIWNEDSIFARNYHKVKYNVDNPSSYVDVDITVHHDYMSNDNNKYPVRVKDSSGTIICQGITRGRTDNANSGFGCRVNDGEDYTIERNYYFDNTNWAHVNSGVIYSGSIFGDITMNTIHHKPYTHDVRVELGTNYANEKITIYDVRRTDTLVGENFNLIGCQGYTDSQGSMMCALRSYRMMEIYRGNRNTGDLLMRGANYIHPRMANRDFIYRVDDLEDLVEFRINDHNANNIDNDPHSNRPMEVYDENGKLIASAATINKVFNYPDGGLFVMVPRNKLISAFYQIPQAGAATTEDFILGYYGRVSGPTSATVNTHGSGAAYNTNLEVYVENLDTAQPINAKQVIVTRDDGREVCKGYTDSNGLVLCSVSDYAINALVDAKPKYSINVSGSVTNPTIQLDYSATANSNKVNTFTIPSNFGPDYIFTNTEGWARQFTVTNHLEAGVVTPIKSVKITAGQGSDLEKGTLKVQILTEAGVIIANEEVTLYRAGTSSGGTIIQTDAQGLATFANIDSYFAYDVKTKFGEKTNIYIQPGESTEIKLRKSSSDGIGDSLQTRESRPSLLTLSGSLKDKLGAPIKSGSFKVKIKDNLEGVWYNFDTTEGFCFENKMNDVGNFAFIIGGKNPLFLVQDKIYTVDIDVYLDATCTAIADDSFTTYFKG